MTNLDSILKSIDITLPTKVHLVKYMVFPYQEASNSLLLTKMEILIELLASRSLKKINKWESRLISYTEEPEIT